MAKDQRLPAEEGQRPEPGVDPSETGWQRIKDYQWRKGGGLSHLEHTMSLS